MSKLLRDVFNKKAVTELSERLQARLSTLDREMFILDACKGFRDLGYAERLEQITDAIYKHLPKNYEDAVEILKASVTGELAYDDDFKFREEHFINLPLCRYVSKYGLDSYETSMDALRAMTSSFTSEYDIRYFVEHHTERSIEMMMTWADSENLHIRRLASEGSRPRLPMGKHLHSFIKDPAPILPLLEKLKNDPVLYVRRSAANSLNDISKDHPDLAADIAERWMKENFQHAEWVCTHAMRTLFKQGHSKALRIFGYLEPVKVDAWGLDIKNTTINMGDDLEFSFVVDNSSKADAELMIDYEIHFLKSNKQHAPKVFKLKKTTLKAGKKLKLSGKYPFRDRTTRKYYTGRHYICILINGARFAPAAFFVNADMTSR